MGSRGIRDRVVIVGMGSTPFGEHWGRSVDDLLVDAVGEAVTSAGITLDDIDAFWFGTQASGVSGLALSRTLRLPCKPVTRLENMCATGSEVLRNACYGVASGAYDVAMAVGVEKLKDSGMSGLSGTTSPGAGDDSRGEITASANFSLLAPAYAAEYMLAEEELKGVTARIAWKTTPTAHVTRAPSSARKCRWSASGRLRSSRACWVSSVLRSDPGISRDPASHRGTRGPGRRLGLRSRTARHRPLAGRRWTTADLSGVCRRT